jgi:hypothetical protein
MSKAIKTFAIATVIAAFASVAFAQDNSARPSQDPPLLYHRGPIYNGSITSLHRRIYRPPCNATKAT